MSKGGSRTSFNCVLNSRNYNFHEFIANRLDELREHLIQECERIAVQRELQLKMEIHKMHGEVAALTHKLSIAQTEATSAGNAIAVADGAGDDMEAAAEASPAPQDRSFEVSIDDGIALNDTLANGNVSTGEADNTECMDLATAVANGDSQSASDEAGQNEEDDFNLWPEWEQPLHRTLSRVSTEADDSKLESDWLHGSDGKEPPGREARSICTIRPNSLFALSWDLLGVPILLYDLVALPLQVFWDDDDGPGPVVDWTVVMYWTTDIFLRLFVVGFITHTYNVVLKRKAIMRNYVHHAFLFDLFMVAPDWISMCFDMPRNLAMFRVFRTLRFMRLARMNKLRETTRKLQDMLDSEYFSVYINVMWNITLILFICHYMSCLWFWVGSQENEGYLNWVTKFGWIDQQQSITFKESNWEYQYLTCLHWALCQFTPGSMRVHPTNPIERIVAILALLWGMIFFSFFISGVTQERMRLQGMTKKMDRDNWLLRRYMKQNGVSRGLSMRAVKYVDAFVAPMMLRVQRKDVALLASLSRPLQLEVQAEIYFHTLLVHPFLASLKEKSTLMASNLFSDVVAEISLAKNDLLFEVGQVSHEMFFLSHGVVGYLQLGANSAICIQTREWCCEQVIWVPWVHKGTCKAIGESLVLSVDSSKFRTGVLEYSERDYVRDCAQTYLEALRECVSAGVLVDDLIQMHKRDPSFAEVRPSFEADKQNPHIRIFGQ